MKPIASLAAVSLFAVTACVPRPQPSPPVQARPSPAPAPAPLPPPAPANWLDAPQTPGDWRYRAAARESRASYSNGETLLFQMVCTADRRVALVRPNFSGTQMRVRTETIDRTLPADGRPAAVMATLPANDRLLDAMALSKGRFAVEVAGAPTLYLPSWAEVTRVIEDCR